METVRQEDGMEAQALQLCGLEKRVVYTKRTQLSRKKLASF